MAAAVTDVGPSRLELGRCLQLVRRAGGFYNRSLRVLGLKSGVVGFALHGVSIPFSASRHAGSCDADQNYHRAEPAPVHHLLVNIA